jgi:Na+/melibiose symporter-like transporter
LFIFVSAVATAKRGAGLSKVPDLPPFSVKQFTGDMASCLQNKNYVMLLLGLVAVGPFIGTRETLQTYLTTFFWEVPVAKIGLISMATVPAFILIFVAVPRLHARYSKRAVMLGGLLLSMLSASVPITLRLLGWLPDNSDPWIYRMLLIERFVFYLGFSSFVLSVMSALGDVADEHELSTGRRQEGMFYAARSFFGKVTQGLGHLLAGISLDLIGFQPGSKVGDVPQDVLVWLGLVDGPIVGMFGIVAMFLYGRYAIDKHRHIEIRSELAQRAAHAASVSAERAVAPERAT